MEIKLLYIKAVLISAMAAGRGLSGQEHCTPVPFELAGRGCFYGKSFLAESRLLLILTGLVTAIHAFLLYPVW